MIGYIAVSDFAGNYRKAYTYFWMMRWCKMLEYSRFIRRINEMEPLIEKLFIWLGDVFIKLEGAHIYSVDSFPVELYIKELYRYCCQAKCNLSYMKFSKKPKIQVTL